MDLVSKGIWYLFSAIIAILCIYYTYKVHKDPKSDIDLRDLFTVVNASGEKVIDGSKARMNSAFLVCTWALIYLVLTGALSEWFFAAYLAAWVYDRDRSRKAANGDA